MRLDKQDVLLLGLGCWAPMGAAESIVRDDAIEYKIFHISGIEMIQIHWEYKYPLLVAKFDYMKLKPILF